LASFRKKLGGTLERTARPQARIGFVPQKAGGDGKGGNSKSLLGGDIMLYESTRGLLQSIVQSLETGEQTQWDDRTESGYACLYEMHQMRKPLYKAYESDSPKVNSAGKSAIPESLSRAIPHVRTMVIAIRHKNRTRAIASGRAALAEMNCAGHSGTPDKNGETEKPSKGLRRHEKSTGKQRAAA
jgi:hypothetical protein